MLYASPVPQTAGAPKPFNQRALQLAAASSKRLTKTFAATPTDLTKQTFSAYVKIAAYPGADSYLFAQFTGGSAYGTLLLTSDGSIRFQQDNDGATLKSSFKTLPGTVPIGQKCHWCVSFDSTQAVAADRLKVWIDRVQVTSFDFMYSPTLNYQAEWLGTQRLHEVGAYGGGNFWNDKIDEFAFVEGAALDVSSFIDASLRPLDLSGLPFGNNSVWLRFEDPNDLGHDSSGKGNHFALNNITSADSIAAFA